MFLLYVILLAAFLLYLYDKHRRAFHLPADFPPGPRDALPVIGHAHAFGPDLCRARQMRCR